MLDLVRWVVLGQHKCFYRFAEDFVTLYVYWFTNKTHSPLISFCLRALFVSLQYSFTPNCVKLIDLATERFTNGRPNFSYDKIAVICLKKPVMITEYPQGPIYPIKALLLHWISRLDKSFSQTFQLHCIAKLVTQLSKAIWKLTVRRLVK